MKKVLITLVMLVGIAIAGKAQETVTINPNPDPNAAEIAFDTEVIDFGTVEYGADITKEFRFRNTGKSVLILDNVKPGCGCTTPTWSKDPVKPGGSGIIKVQYDTKRVGSFEKTITVTSNAKTASKVIRIKGVVKPNPNPAPQDK